MTSPHTENILGCTESTMLNGSAASIERPPHLYTYFLTGSPLPLLQLSPPLQLVLRRIPTWNITYPCPADSLLDPLSYRGGKTGSKGELREGSQRKGVQVWAWPECAGSFCRMKVWLSSARTQSTNTHQIRQIFAILYKNTFYFFLLLIKLFIHCNSRWRKPFTSSARDNQLLQHSCCVWPTFANPLDSRLLSVWWLAGPGCQKVHGWWAMNPITEQIPTLNL